MNYIRVIFHIIVIPFSDVYFDWSITRLPFRLQCYFNEIRTEPNLSEVSACILLISEYISYKSYNVISFKPNFLEYNY